MLRTHPVILKKRPKPNAWVAHGSFPKWYSKPNAWVSHDPIQIKAQSSLLPTLMILDLVESKPQIQWFTHEILWNKAQVWNSQSIELMSLSTCSKIVLKIERACFTKVVNKIIAPRTTRIKLDYRRINLKKAQFAHHQISQWTKKAPTMPWRTQVTRHAIRDLIDQKTIFSSSLGGKFNFSWAKWSFHKLPYQDLIHEVVLSFFCSSSLCVLIWILRNMLLRFWL